VSNEAIFATWSAAAGPWAQWIKASLFAQAPAGVEPITPAPRDVSWAPAAADTALVVDLPGVESIAFGCSLASRGYCPVPAFNTSPGTTAEVVKTWDIMAALLGAAPLLPQSNVGPPAFLLDIKRTGQDAPLTDATFDNRWFVFKSDLPSAQRLREQGIRRLAVVCREGRFGFDLRDALAEHRDLELSVLDAQTGSAGPFPPPASGVVRMFRTFGRLLRRNMDGSFGRPISHG